MLDASNVVVMPNSYIDMDATKKFAESAQEGNVWSRSSPDSFAEKAIDNVLGDPVRWLGGGSMSAIYDLLWLASRNF